MQDNSFTALLMSIIIVLSKNDPSLSSSNKETIETAAMGTLDKIGYMPVIRQAERNMHNMAEHEVRNTIGDKAANAVIPVLYAGKAYVDGVLITKIDFCRLHISKEYIELSDIKLKNTSLWIRSSLNNDVKSIGLSVPF